jgi:hypothetical protein
MADKIVRATGRRPGPPSSTAFSTFPVRMRGESERARRRRLRRQDAGTEGQVGERLRAVAEQPIAAVAPHAPDAPNPQGIAPGTQISGTGRLITPSADPEVAAVAPVGADAPSRPRPARKPRPRRSSRAGHKSPPNSPQAIREGAEAPAVVSWPSGFSATAIQGRGRSSYR